MVFAFDNLFFLVTEYSGLHISFEWQINLFVLATNAIFANEELLNFRHYGQMTVQLFWHLL